MKVSVSQSVYLTIYLYINTLYISNPICCQIEDMYRGGYSGISSPNNTEGNQCGLVINRATIEDQGTWICKIYIKGTVLLGSKIINLAGNDSNIY